VSMGVYVFEPVVLSFIPSGCPYDIPDLIKVLLQNGQPVAAYKFGGYWQDIGRFDDYQKAVEDFENRQSEFLSESAGGSQA
jgi:NDP-sugar pyrophosphorylase family protein